MFMNRPWIIQVWVINIHNPFKHYAMSQYVLKPRDVIMLMSAVTIVAAFGNSTVRHTVTMSRPFKWHVSPRLSNAMGQIANLKNILRVIFVLYSLDKSHLNSVCTQYVCDKSENARVCAKWQWNALDWCYWIALPASPVVPSTYTVSCVSLSFHKHTCVLPMQQNMAVPSYVQALYNIIWGMFVVDYDSSWARVFRIP